VVFFLSVIYVRVLFSLYTHKIFFSLFEVVCVHNLLRFCYFVLHLVLYFRLRVSNLGFRVGVRSLEFGAMFSSLGYAVLV